VKLEAIIKIASAAYDPDDPQLVMWYHQDPLGNYGDGLAKFIAVEIAETYDPTATDDAQLSEATRVCSSGGRQLEDVAAALAKKAVTHEAARRRKPRPVRK
jgi:hypothetical protein